MTDEHSPATSNRTPRFVPGVYNYCDRWCERCRFQTRCRLYRDVQRMDAATAAEPVLAESQDEDDEVTETAPTNSREWLEFLADVNREPTAAELEEARQEEARIDAALARDPVAISASEYTEIVMGICAGLDPLFEPARDAVIEAALDTIHRLGILVGVKVNRASRALLRADGDDELDDANSTAKLVRLIIRESGEAWQVLMLPGRGVGDGVPARMVARLDALDAAMASRFPAAMDAIRPGFDE